jgi:ACS family glucarate transporter-like MFS transporter
MDSIENSTGSRPTWCRWYVVAMATLMSIILYLDRFCWSFSKTLIQEDVGISSADADFCLSCFFAAYALAQVPSGWLSDRWGSRIVLALYIFLWSLFTILIGWSASWIMLVAMQLGLGLSQAGAYPTSASMLSRWMPISTRGTASSFVAFGGRAGGAIAPILTAWLIVTFVPVETSSLITPKQLLPGGLGAFCRNLNDSESTTGTVKVAHPELSSQIRSVMPTAAWKVIRDVAQQEEQRRESLAAASEQNAKGQVSEIIITPDQREELAAGLNAALKHPDLVTSEIRARLNLDREAVGLLARRDAGTSLSEPQIERVNRLVLEKAFPTAIGKIYVKGWRHVYTVYGVAGIVIALMFFLVVRNRPEEQPLCNAAEVNLIRSGLPPAPSTLGKQPALPWGKILRSASLWYSSLTQFGTNVGWLFVTAKLPEYLETVHHVEISRRGLMSSWPMIGGIAGLLLGGRLTDWLRPRLGLRWGRSIPMGLTKIGAAAAYIGCIFTQDPVTAALLCSVVAFFLDMGVAASWAFVQDAGGRYVGVVLGFGNMWGNIGAAVAPIIYSSSIAWTKDLQWSKDGWNTCFLLCAIVLLASGITGILIDATKPIVSDDPA